MTGDFKRPYLLRISQKLTKRYGSNHCYPWSVADPDQAFVGISQIGGRQNVFTCLIPLVCCNSRWVSHKRGYLL